MKPSHFRDLIDFLVKEHFDKNCNLIIGNNKADQLSINNINKMTNLGLMSGMPMNSNKMMASAGQMMAGMPTAPTMQVNTNTGGKKKGNKVNLKNPIYYGRSSGKAQNFVSVNRDPPSGHSAGDSDECSAINLGNY